MFVLEARKWGSNGVPGFRLAPRSDQTKSDTKDGKRRHLLLDSIDSRRVIFSFAEISKSGNGF